MSPGVTHIIGCGEIGRRVAAICLDHGQSVTAWVRTKSSYQACRKLELSTHYLDLDQPVDLNHIGRSSQILYTVPPPPLGRHDPRLKSLLTHPEMSQVGRLVLISTTGVYGDCAGAWVNETTTINPTADRALRRADAEAQLQEWADLNRVDYLILRVPGIYAADRLPLKRLESGAPLVAREEAPWTNRIHADDLASACFAALNSQVTNEIINIADDAPSTMTDYFFAVADYTGLTRPAEISLQEAEQRFSSGMLSYLAESRRIDNRKMKVLLKISLRYPTLKDGLAHG